jgi:hypothetical protein
MSKEHIQTAHTLSAQLKTGLGILLLCLPLAPPAETPVPGIFLQTVLLAAVAAGIAAEILRRLPPFAANRPRVLWIALLIPLALPRVFPVFPVPLEAALYLLPLLLLSRTARFPRLLHLALTLFGAAALTLWIGQTDGPALPALLPGILFFFLPLALCLRKPWRFFGFPAAATSLALLLLTLHLTPLHYWQTTARMTAAEARERVPGTAPAPRYRPAPDAPPALPGDFSPDLVAFIHARQSALSRSALHALFENAPLPPDEMIRALRVYGFIQHDRHGFHVPSEAFTLDPAEHLASDYILWVEKLRAHAGIDPDSLPADLLREARRNEILLPVRPGAPLLRFSANHRARLDNGLLPRQILTLLDLDSGTPPLTAEAYARTWSLSLTAAEAELRTLSDTGHLEPVRLQARDVRPPPVTLPDANRGLRILLRIALAALGLLLLRAGPEPLRRNLHILGGLSVWGFTATELAASAQTLPAASLLALWLTPVSLLLLTAVLWVRPAERLPRH